MPTSKWMFHRNIALLAFPHTQPKTMLKHWSSLMLSCCVYTAKHILSFNIMLKVLTPPPSSSSFRCTMLAVYRSLVGKYFFLACVSCTQLQKTKLEKKPERFYLFLAVWNMIRACTWLIFVFQFVQNIQPALLLFARSSRRIFNFSIWFTKEKKTDFLLFHCR